MTDPAPAPAQNDNWPATPAAARVPPDPDHGTLDCLIVGGGPAGLTAAIYMGRFRRKAMVIDSAAGRLQMIPRSRNAPGYPQGIVGIELLDRMRDQALEYGAALEHGEVSSISRDGKLFAAETPLGLLKARSVLLATGVVNHRPPLSEEVHDDAVKRGLLRYCPICDGFEQSGKRIGVVGGNRHGLAEAIFLRTYSPQITLISMQPDDLTDAERAEAAKASIQIVGAEVSSFDFSGSEVEVTLADGGRLTFDTLYAALGSHTRNELGVMLGTELVGGQCFATDEHQRTTVPGVYAAGDAVEGLDQISVAMGTAARAAVAIHNDLRAQDQETLTV